jgi:chromate transporter
LSGDNAVQLNAAPQSAIALFWFFTKLALQGFGGVLPVAQHALVDKQRWLTRQQFAETLSIAQVLPGPNIVNLALIVGDRFLGWRGAMAALAGMLGIPLVIVLLLAVLYANVAQHAVAAGALRGMGAVAAGLVLGMALKLMPALMRNPSGLLISLGGTVLTIAAVAWLRLPMAAAVLGLGSLWWATAWWHLSRERWTV